jgi:small subunit ribosomal protein S4e
MKEVNMIVKQRLVKIDGQVRTDPRFPTGFMDVVQIEKTGENFRIIYDVKGRFIVHRITAQEAKYKLCKVREVRLKFYLMIFRLVRIYIHTGI